MRATPDVRVFDDPQALSAYFERHGIDCLKLVPGHLEAHLDGPPPGASLPRS